MRSSSASLPLVLLLLFTVGTTCSAQSSSSDDVVAVVNGQRISIAQIDEFVLPQILPLQQQLYAIRKSALESLIVRALLMSEANKRKVSTEELQRQLTSASVVVSDEQVEALYQENAAAFGAMSPDEARQRLRLDLESQGRMRNYRSNIAALREHADVSIFLEEPTLPIEINDQAATKGSEKAIVTVAEFSDFQCPYCRQAQAALLKILRDFSSEVRLVFKHLPLDIHAQAFNASRATVCAGQQGKFWGMHDSLFSSTDLTGETINKFVQSVNLDPTEFGECMSGEASRFIVEADLRDARKLGLTSTPTFLINGKLVRGAATFEILKEAIESELRIARAKPNKISTPLKERKQ
jgi:predicted DsbA family dithiol-disulfide isomerase